MDLGFGMKGKRFFAQNRWDIAALTALFFLAVLVHGTLGNFNKQLRTYRDELRYVSLARSFAVGHGLSMRGAPTNFQKIGYPLAIAPFFKLGDPIKQERAVNWFNSVLLLSSIFLAWLIAAEIGLSRKYRFWLAIVTGFWPETFVTMTFMSENLYWPLFLLFVWLWLKNEKRPSIMGQILLGVFCYAFYLCKEIALAMVLAVVILCLATPSASGRKIRDRLKYALSFAGAFAICHLAMKTTFFSGLGNSYDQTSLAALASLYNSVFAAYSFLHLLSAALLAVLVVPFVYPLAHYRELDDPARRLERLVVIFLLLALATIAYTISVREDLGNPTPRVHTRYLAPALIVQLAVFLSYVQNANGLKRNALETSLLIAATFFCGLMFKGSPFRGSSQDDYCLSWTYWARDCLTMPDLTFNAGLFLLSAALFASVFLLYLLHRKGKFFGFLVLYSLLLAGCILWNDIVKCGQLRHHYRASPKLTADVVDLDRQLRQLPEDTRFAVVLDRTNPVSEMTRHVDSFLTIAPRCFFMDAAEHGRETIISGGELPGGGADYIIVPKLPAIFGSYRLADVEPVTSFTNRTFHIFRNLNPERISIVKNPDAFFCGEPKRIRFTTDACNASLATLSGISHPEPRFSWTSGKLFSFSMPMDRPYGEIKVDIVVERTFNGRQRFLIRSEEDFVACGVVEKATTLSFRLKPKDLMLGFSIELPDARRVSEVRPDQQDTRVLALGIREIRLAAED